MRANSAGPGAPWKSGTKGLAQSPFIHCAPDGIDDLPVAGSPANMISVARFMVAAGR